MGSLPNLHELGKEELYHHQKLGPVLSNPHQHHVGHSSLSQEERNRILHRHSTHCKIRGRTHLHCHGALVADKGVGGKVCQDDHLIMEQMATYSPISARSSRNLNHHSVRRRDSINSSIGANSVRRLIAVVRNTSSRSGPTYSRKVLTRNLALMCLTHFLSISTLLPFLALQGSVSVWTQPDKRHPISVNLGSMLLGVMYFEAAIFTLFGPSLMQKFGGRVVFTGCYLGLGAFYVVHLHPVIHVLAPAYLIFGMFLGPLGFSKVSFLMAACVKLSNLHGEEDEDVKTLRRTCVVRRVARGFQAAHDFGLILGSLLTAIIITVTLNPPTAVLGPHGNTTFANGTNASLAFNPDLILDQIFDSDELGDRICGSAACPSGFQLTTTLHVLPKGTRNLLVALYAGLTLVAASVVAFCLDKINLYGSVYGDAGAEGGFAFSLLKTVRDSFKDNRLKLAAPLAFFIGVEQAFMYSDFSETYVICTLGIQRVNLVFLCMGLLQSVAACTLSMLLRSIRRYYVIAVGFMFHSCLLMVQILWKPMGDDPALFYVIASAWGVCNAVWEMMNFTLVTGLYTENWEGGFANSLFLRSLGMAVAFGAHGLLCNWLKLYILASLLVASVVPFAFLEVRLENTRRVRNVSRL